MIMIILLEPHVIYKVCYQYFYVYSYFVEMVTNSYVSKIFIHFLIDSVDRSYFCENKQENQTGFSTRCQCRPQRAGKDSCCCDCCWCQVHTRHRSHSGISGGTNSKIFRFCSALCVCVHACVHAPTGVCMCVCTQVCVYVRFGVVLLVQMGC